MYKYKVYVLQKGQLIFASLLDEAGNGLGYEFDSEEEAMEAVEAAAHFSIFDGGTRRLSKGSVEIVIQRVFK